MCYPCTRTPVDTVLDGYAARLAIAPDRRSRAHRRKLRPLVALRLQVGDPAARQLLEVQPDDLYGTLFRGSNRLFLGKDVDEGAADLEQAIALAPSTPTSASSSPTPTPTPCPTLSEPSRRRRWRSRGARHATNPRDPRQLLSRSVTSWPGRHTSSGTSSSSPPSSCRPSHRRRHLPAPRPGPGPNLRGSRCGGRRAADLDHDEQPKQGDLRLHHGPPRPRRVARGRQRRRRGLLRSIEWVPPVTATYRLRVTSFEGVGTGELVVREAEPFEIARRIGRAGEEPADPPPHPSN